MNKILASALAIFSAPALLASPRLQMVDRVQSVSRSSDGKSYDVLFVKHSAYYHVSADSAALTCLIRSMDENIAVSVSGDAMSLMISKCSDERESR